jgi:hypothetical protein
LFDAHRSGVPDIAIVAHIPTPEIGGNYFQEKHPQILFKELAIALTRKGFQELSGKFCTSLKRTPFKN